MVKSRRLLVTIASLLFFCVCAALSAAEPVISSPFESNQWTIPKNVIDVRVEAALAKHGLAFRRQCSDAVFVRRVYLDMIGTLPTPTEVDAFLNDHSPDKRAALIDSLFSRDEYADYWSLKWCDLLRVKSEYPINLWPDAVQAYHRWIRDSIRENVPYDRFARELLTASGSNFFYPPANFYRGLQGRDSVSIAKAVALTFMGTRIERWPEGRRAKMAAFFSKVAYKKTREWKEEIVYNNPASSTPAKMFFPDGSSTAVSPDGDPRIAFADWMTAPRNEWFARNIVNRIWYWTMGHGIIHEADDIRSDNPPADSQVLACLEKELIASHYDLRHIYRLILNSRTYQQSSIPSGDEADAKVAFAHYKVRRLDAEVLIDALCRIGGDGEGYSSATPEPYTFIPKENRTIALADGSITSSFLATFGRPSRDTGLESERNNNPTDSQSLYMLNSTDVQRRIERSPQLRDLVSADKKSVPVLVGDVYVFILSRYPTSSESKIAEQYFKTKGLGRRQAVNDLAWALINSKEFLYRH
jgi:hypothetical protein